MFLYKVLKVDFISFLNLIFDFFFRDPSEWVLPVFETKFIIYMYLNMQLSTLSDNKVL